jgi:hypothetical protein
LSLFAHLQPFIFLESNQRKHLLWIVSRNIIKDGLYAGTDSSKDPSDRDISGAHTGTHAATNTGKSHVIKAGEVEEASVGRKAKSALVLSPAQVLDRLVIKDRPLE